MLLTFFPVRLRHDVQALVENPLHLGRIVDDAANSAAYSAFNKAPSFNEFLMFTARLMPMPARLLPTIQDLHV